MTASKHRLPATESCPHCILSDGGYARTCCLCAGTRTIYGGNYWGWAWAFEGCDCDACKALALALRATCQRCNAPPEPPKESGPAGTFREAMLRREHRADAAVECWCRARRPRPVLVYHGPAREPEALPPLDPTEPTDEYRVPFVCDVCRREFYAKTHNRVRCQRCGSREKYDRSVGRSRTGYVRTKPPKLVACAGCNEDFPSYSNAAKRCERCRAAWALVRWALVRAQRRDERRRQKSVVSCEQPKQPRSEESPDEASSSLGGDAAPAHAGAGADGHLKA